MIILEIGHVTQLATTMGDDLLPMEVAVATAGGASEELWRALVPSRHELTTPVDNMATDAYCVVLEALAVPEIGRRWRQRLGQSRHIGEFS